MPLNPNLLDDFNRCYLLKANVLKSGRVDEDDKRI